MKFGGTSVAGAGPISQVGQIVKRYYGRRPGVGVSALAGVTDELIAAGNAAAKGKRTDVRRRLQRLTARHDTVVRRLGLDGRARAAVQRDIGGEFAELDEVLH